MCCRYYMRFTGMNEDEVEMNTNRDYFMTPEEAVQLNIIDHIIREEGDYTVPPSMARQYREKGYFDRLSGRGETE